MKCLLYFLQNILFSFLSVQCDAYNVKSENVLQLLGDNVKISQVKPSIDISPDYLKWSENQQKYFTSMKNNAVPRNAVYKSQASTTPSGQAFINSQSSLSTNNKQL
ncbi:unnamed protein product [Trichobilharzia szidati]|nr:unnamed protein product [Trichobilharzia szidati]